MNRRVAGQAGRGCVPATGPDRSPSAIALRRDSAEEARAANQRQGYVDDPFQEAAMECWIRGDATADELREEIARRAAELGEAEEADGTRQGSDPTGYCYHHDGSDPDRTNVLRNRFGLRSGKALAAIEYAMAATRHSELLCSDGPKGRFDAAHLGAIHRHIFQDVYDWAGHMRNERPVVDGTRVQAIGSIMKGGSHFLPAQNIAMGLNEAFRATGDRASLRTMGHARLAETLGTILSELNYVHPFREGNGRTQEVFVMLLARSLGRPLILKDVSGAAMVAASIETFGDPTSPAMTSIMLDALDRSAFDQA